MVVKYSECVHELLPVMFACKKFRIKLQHTGEIYNPSYTSAIYFEGDIVAFATQTRNPTGYFIARIVRKFLHDYTTCYDVQCILRPKNRDAANRVNWLAKTNITTKLILCKLKLELRTS